MSLLSKFAVPEPRPSEGIETISEIEFKRRFEARFIDPWFDAHRASIHQLAEVAWAAHQNHRKAPLTTKAGPSYKDPEYHLSDDWLKAKQAIEAAERRHKDPSCKSRVLVISGADRNDQTCPGEVSKSRRLAQIAQKTIEAESGFETELLDLSLITSEFGKTIHACKACVSTAMPLCHYPCSCYPNYSLGQVDDWMNEIYPMFSAAHGIMIVTPVYWYQAPSALKLLIDRLVCADGGNPDPTSTHGKSAIEAKRLEADGWTYPKHLEGRVFGTVVHGDTAGVDQLRTALTSWANDLQLINASNQSDIARFIGYYEPYYKSHVALDKDEAIQEETRNVARSIALTILETRGRKTSRAPELTDPRPK